MTTNTNNAPATQSGTESVEAAAALIERLGSGSTGTPRRTSAKAETVPDEVLQDDDEDILATEADETAREDEDGDELSEDDRDADEEATDATDEDAEEGSEEQDQLVTVKVDGKEVEVPLKEALAGYQRTADYHRKTEALADERRSFHAEREQVQQERAAYAQLLPALVQQLQTALPQAPDATLRQTDPLEYMLQKEQYEEQMQRIWAANSEYERVTQAQQKDELSAFQERVKEAAKKLPDLVPEWKDPKVYEQERPKLRAYLKRIGYSDQEINAASDPRAVALARKAMRYEDLVTRRPRPDVRQPERVPRPAAVVPPVPRRDRELRNARQRLAQSGRVEDAAYAIGLLGD